MSSPLPLIISFFTKETLYEKEVQNLIESCERLGLEYDIVGVPNLGDWNTNCHLKPPFILDRLKKHQRPILWLDADSVLHKEPLLFATTKAHFMVRMRSDVNFDHFDKVISSTVFVKNSAEGEDIVRKWCIESRETKNQFCDQECLKNALQRYDLTHLVESVPVNYCKIEGLDPKCGDMVIQQFQASRLLRKIVDQEVTHFDFLETLSPEELQKMRFSLE